MVYCSARSTTSKVSGIEVVHVRNQRLRLVERASAVDDLQSTLGDQEPSSPTGDGSSLVAEHTCSTVAGQAAFFC